MKNILLIILPITLFFYSCGDETAGPTSTELAEDYFPLEVGRYWVMNVYDYNANGSLEYETLRKYRDSLIKKDMIQGKEAYILAGGGTVAYTTEGSNFLIYDSQNNLWIKYLDLSKNNWEFGKKLDTTYKTEEGDNVHRIREETATFKRSKIESIEFDGELREAQKVEMSRYKYSYYKINNEIETDTVNYPTREFVFLKSIGVYSVSNYIPNPEDEDEFSPYGSYQELVETGVK